MHLKELVYADKLRYYTRDKLTLIDILLSKVSNKNNNRILSVGCGTAEELKILSKYGEVYAIDVEKKVLKFLSKYKEFYKKARICNVCELSFPNNFFDIVVALDVIEHIEDDKKAVEQIYRVLSPNGVFIFTVPAFQFLFSAHDKSFWNIKEGMVGKCRNLYLRIFPNLKCFFIIIFFFSQWPLLEF
jgi:ubiquinone/menaquinone biosynthesis C-methylase UbiE